MEHGWRLAHRRLFLIAVLVAVSVSSAFALEFPPLSGRVVDQAGILDVATEKRITDLMRGHETATSNQVVVATVPSLQNLTIEEFGVRLARHWGIGQKGTNNGVVLIVAPTERKVRIEVGYGLEGVLTDALCRTIIEQDILPAFKRGDMAGGVENGVQTIIKALGGQSRAAPPPRSNTKTNWEFIVILIFLAVILFKILDVSGYQSSPRHGRKSRHSGSGGFGGGGGFSGGGGGFGGGGASGGW